MFSLEKLSKIKGAQEQNDIMSFFDVLDKYISDEDVKSFSVSNANKQIMKSNQLRKDEVVENTNQQIVDAFPQKEDGYLRIPKVIE